MPRGRKKTSNPKRAPISLRLTPDAYEGLASLAAADPRRPTTSQLISTAITDYLARQGLEAVRVFADDEDPIVDPFCARLPQDAEAAVSLYDDNGDLTRSVVPKLLKARESAGRIKLMIYLPNPDAARGADAGTIRQAVKALADESVSRPSVRGTITVRFFDGPATFRGLESTALIAIAPLPYATGRDEITVQAGRYAVCDAWAEPDEFRAQVKWLEGVRTGLERWSSRDAMTLTLPVAAADLAAGGSAWLSAIDHPCPPYGERALRVFASQTDSYAEMARYIRTGNKGGPLKVWRAVFLEYSSHKAEILLEAVLSSPGEKEVVIYVHEPELDKKYLDSQSRRIVGAVSFMPDLFQKRVSAAAGGKAKVTVYPYAAPASVKGCLINDDLLLIGWYRYAVERMSNMLLLDGHRTPGLLVTSKAPSHVFVPLRDLFNTVADDCRVSCAREPFHEEFPTADYAAAMEKFRRIEAPLTDAERAKIRWWERRTP